MLLSAGWFSESWQFLVGLTIGLIGLAAGYTYFQINRRVKTLDWQSLGNLRIVSSPPQVSESMGLEVTWQGVLVKEPRLIRLRILNSGNQ
ncbi:MAG: hypothetical protein ACR2JG_14965 [Geodermatophilaceae bacterium]